MVDDVEEADAMAQLSDLATQLDTLLLVTVEPGCQVDDWRGFRTMLSDVC